MDTKVFIFLIVVWNGGSFILSRFLTDTEASAGTGPDRVQEEYVCVPPARQCVADNWCTSCRMTVFDGYRERHYVVSPYEVVSTALTFATMVLP